MFINNFSESIDCHVRRQSVSFLEQLIESYFKILQLVEKKGDLLIFSVEFPEMIDDHGNSYPKQKKNDRADLSIIRTEYIIFCGEIHNKQHIDTCRDDKFREIKSEFSHNEFIKFSFFSFD